MTVLIVMVVQLIDQFVIIVNLVRERRQWERERECCVMLVMLFVLGRDRWRCEPSFEPHFCTHRKAHKMSNRASERERLSRRL